MPNRSLQAAGAFAPEELDLLSRVFDQVIMPSDTENDRVDQAIAIMSLFRSGVDQEDKLVSTISMQRLMLERA